MKLPPLGKAEELRLRQDMADWPQTELIAVAAKEPGLSAGIAAQQILSERRAKEESARHAQLLVEVRTPHWTVAPMFGIAVVTLALAAAAVVLALPLVQQFLTPAQPVASASQPATPAASIASAGSAPPR